MLLSKQVPTDMFGHIAAGGSENITFEKTTTAGWDEVTLPAGEECKNVLIKVRSASDDTAVSEDEIQFLFSSFADGTGGVPLKGVCLGVGKVSGTLGYVYTGTAGLLIVVMLVA